MQFFLSDQRGGAWPNGKYATVGYYPTTWNLSTLDDKLIPTRLLHCYKTCYRKAISGVQGQSPWSGGLGRSPPEGENHFAFGRLIVQLGAKFPQGAGHPALPPAAGAASLRAFERTKLRYYLLPLLGN